MRVPLSTYRLQFTPSFGFRQARSILKYLDELGITDIYASPIFKARPDSLHGYDVTDPGELNQELGGERQFYRLIRSLKARGMGWVQDLTCNHMAFDSGNAMLMDVFEKGQRSRYSNYFDIDWEREGFEGKLIAPVLDKPYFQAMENLEISVLLEKGGFFARYFDLVLPLSLRAYGLILSPCLGGLIERYGQAHPDAIKLKGIINFLDGLEGEENFEKAEAGASFAKGMLGDFFNNSFFIRNSINSRLDFINSPEGSDELHGLLREQFFKFACWKTAAQEINYRRFFNINHLICLKIEEEAAFEDVHALLLRLVEEKSITGLRIDHVDGLYSPEDYLEKLKKRAGGIYIVVEKILSDGEDLPGSWPVEGTTGYEFLNQLNGIFIDAGSEKSFSRAYLDFTVEALPYDELLYSKKKQVINEEMHGEAGNLAWLLKNSAALDRHSVDLPHQSIKEAVKEVIASFPVYRTYVAGPQVSEADARYIKMAARDASRRAPALANEIAYIEKALLLDAPGRAREEIDKLVDFVSRFQQMTGPVMAKGFEDTFLYSYNRLISLNEVGGNPGSFGNSIGDFHEFNGSRAKKHPGSMSATSTHDSKRGEDVRARLNAITEFPDEWLENVKRWKTLNLGKRLKGNPSPASNDEYALYQTLIGVFPLDLEADGSFIERVKQYALKASREAKANTSWLSPDLNYEEGLLFFIERILEPRCDFLKDFLLFQKKIAFYGIFNSLSQTLIKIASPGAPDFYQGTELWDFDLADPDNRHEVDYEERIKLLRQVRNGYSQKESFSDELLKKPHDGGIKLFLINKALEQRKKDPDIFLNGDYTALSVTGEYSESIIAFARISGKKAAIVLAPRFLSKVISPGQLPTGDAWKDTAVTIPECLRSDTWVDAFTGRAHSFINGNAAASEAFCTLPFSMLFNWRS